MSNSLPGSHGHRVAEEAFDFSTELQNVRLALNNYQFWTITAQPRA